MTSVGAMIYISWYSDHKDDVIYLHLGELPLAKEFIIRMGNWILIFGNFVPIS